MRWYENDGKLYYSNYYYEAGDYCYGHSEPISQKMTIDVMFHTPLGWLLTTCVLVLAPAHLRKYSEWGGLG